MAFINGKFLEREERQARIEAVTERLKKLRDIIQAGKHTEYHVDLMRKDRDELIKLKRVHRAEVDMLYFFYEYFSEARNPGNPDNLVPTTAVDMDDAPNFHAKLSSILDSVSNRNKTARIAWAASRGHAKSAYLSNAYPVREIVYKKRRMILIISETNDGSIKFIKWVAGQLKYNQKLREDFGEVLYEQKTRNEKDSETSFITTTGIKMEATSLGKQIRGFRNGSQRPDLVLLDDLESLDSTNTPELRQKAKDWLNQDLMPAGDPTKTAFIFMGTLVHFDSLLNYVLNERRDFIKNSFPAIIKPPKRTDLWAEFERIYREYEPSDEEVEEMMQSESEDSLSTPNARAAMLFYEEHKAEMDEGVEVLWPERFPLPALIIEKDNIGTKAFNTEFMSNPIDEDSQIFKPESFSYWTDFRLNHKEFSIYMGIDFAMGKEKGDFSAIVTIAKHKKTGKIHVIDAYGERLHPDKFLKVIVEKVMEYQPDRIAAESQNAQEWFVDAIKRELALKGYPSTTRVSKINQRSRKALRIEALKPQIEKGEIEFHRSQTLLLEQFERYGSNWHDDLPDALEMAVSVSKRAKTVIKAKPKYM
ncbi:phage terminase large subunit [Bacillus safensis]|uniref:phage terminase large subunit n=1 Tax=Bacillus safensis TaxID=561879 RepID=UPI002FFECD97